MMRVSGREGCTFRRRESLFANWSRSLRVCNGDREKNHSQGTFKWKLREGRMQQSLCKEKPCKDQGLHEPKRVPEQAYNE